MSVFALDLEDETDVVLMFVFGALATWLAWSYWPAAHDLACPGAGLTP